MPVFRRLLLCPLLTVLACAGSPVESASESAADDDDDDDDSDDDDDGTDDPSGDPTTDPTSDPTTDPTSDPTGDPSDTTNASTDPDTTDAGSDPSTTSAEDDTTTGTLDCHPQLNEIAFNLVGEDGGLEWIAIVNPCDDMIDLAGYALGWGGEDYTYGTLQLAGMLAADGCFVVGGPSFLAVNYTPDLDQSVDLHEDLQNPTPTTGDGIALFVGDAGDITAVTVPIDAVLYGTDNVNDLIDENGNVGQIDVAAGSDMETIARTPGGEWVVNASPSPNDCADPA